VHQKIVWMMMLIVVVEQEEDLQIVMEHYILFIYFLPLLHLKLLYYIKFLIKYRNNLFIVCLLLGIIVFFLYKLYILMNL